MTRVLWWPVRPKGERSIMQPSCRRIRRDARRRWTDATHAPPVRSRCLPRPRWWWACARGWDLGGRRRVCDEQMPVDGQGAVARRPGPELVAAMTMDQKLCELYGRGDFKHYGAANYIPAIPSLCVPSWCTTTPAPGIADARARHDCLPGRHHAGCELGPRDAARGRRGDRAARPGTRASTSSSLQASTWRATR